MLTPAWRLDLQGKVELSRPDGSGVRLATRKIAQLLAFLAIRPGIALARHEVARAVWPDAEPKAARDSLRTALATLKASLPAESLQSTSSTLTLVAGWLECDVALPGGPAPYRAEFMPGFDADWVEALRLDFRRRACLAMIRRAEELRDALRMTEARQVVERACEIDPLSQEAARLNVQLAEQDGDMASAVRLADRFRIKSMRELGVVPEIGTPTTSTTAEHPLLVAAEWLLHRNPAEALEMLAATHAEWLTMPVEAALQMHRRVLMSTDRRSEARGLVEAQYVFLRVLAGRLGADIGAAADAFHASLSLGNGLVSARLAGALAYGYLSRGDFVQSLGFAKRSRACAETTKDPAIEVEFEQLYGIIQWHAESRKAAWHTLRNLESKVLRHGSPQAVVGHGILMLEDLISRRRFEQAALNIEQAKRFYATTSNRVECWVMFGEALLSLSVGDRLQAKATIERIRRQGDAFAGHSITAIIDDYTACIDFELGEHDTAAQALARASAYRKSLGTVASLCERAHVRPTKEGLKQRLGTPALRNIYLAAAEQRRQAAISARANRLA